VLASDISMSSLPEKWFCSMNVWDEKHNSCSKPQEFQSKNDESQPEFIKTPNKYEIDDEKLIQITLEAELSACKQNDEITVVVDQVTTPEEPLSIILQQNIMRFGFIPVINMARLNATSFFGLASFHINMLLICLPK
jgi:hypothetical protein